VVRLFLIFIPNRRRIFRLWSKIENLPKRKKPVSYGLYNKKKLKLTKFLGLHNEFFGQEIQIRKDALTQIHITFHGSILFVPKVISSMVVRVGSLSCIPFESIFRILVMALITSSMCLSMKIQKYVVNEETRLYYVHPLAIEANPMLVAGRAKAGRGWTRMGVHVTGEWKIGDDN